MKLRQEGRKGRGMKAAEVLQPEQVVEDGFNPERDIPPEVKEALFDELDAFGQKGGWLEYVVLFNNLQLLFPDMDGRKKPRILPDELAKDWRNAHQDENRPHEAALHAVKTSSSSYPFEAVVAAELRAFGLSVDSLLTKEGVAAFEEIFREGFEGGWAGFFTNALTLLRLGLRNLDNVFEQKELAWMKLERSIRGNEAHYVVEYLAAAKILFPDKQIEIPPELRNKALQQAKAEVDRFGPIKSAQQYVNLLIATADAVHVGERGELLVRKSTSGRMNTEPSLPERPIH